MKGLKNAIKKDRNPYSLYPSKNRDKATRELTKAINAKDWNKVEKLQEKYRKIGAEDTYSRDKLVESWDIKYHRLPKGFERNR
jgi:hypothetical protein